MFDSLMSSLD